MKNKKKFENKKTNLDVKKPSKTVTKLTPKKTIEDAPAPGEEQAP